MRDPITKLYIDAAGERLFDFDRHASERPRPSHKAVTHSVLVV